MQTIVEQPELAKAGPMAKAVWNGAILAESDETLFLEGNLYFPPDSLNQGFFKESDLHTVCHWKGVASYFDVEVNGEINQGAAWYYPDPSNAAENIRNYVGFWRGVKVEK